MSQITYFFQDVNRLIGKKKIRILHIWLSRAFWGIPLYTFERSLYLILPKAYGYVRIPLTPIYNIIYAYSNLDIHYKADIKGGIKVLHPAVGLVISGQATIGKNLTLTGGNIIGAKRACRKNEFLIVDNCNFGANATLIGPVKIGNNISIGASACVVRDCVVDNVTLIGVPAKPLINNNIES